MSDRFAMTMGAVALLLWMPGAAGAEISTRLTPDAASLFLYEPFTVRLDVDSAAPPETPQLPIVPDLAVISVRRLDSDPAQRTHSFQIKLIAERAGILIVPSFTVRVRNETVLTSALRLHIQAPRAAHEMTLEISIEPTELRVGQPATVAVVWSSAIPFARCKQLRFEIPILADERCHVFPLESGIPDSEKVGLPVNNVRRVARATTLSGGRHSLAFEYKLVPRQPCVLRTRPSRLSCALLREDRPTGQSPNYFYNHFFEAIEDSEVFEQVYVDAAVPALTVKGLDGPGRTAHFSGIVGPCDLSTSVAPTRMTVGQPSLFTVHLDNLSFARHINQLPPAAFDGLRAGFQVSREPIRDTSTATARSFTHILRPLRAGIMAIPAIVVQTFDPETGVFHTVRSDAIPIAVDVDPEDGARVFTPRFDAEMPVALQGVRHNRFDDRIRGIAHHVLECLGQLWWVFVPIPPLFWLASRPLARRWDRCRRDPTYARARAAWRRFRRAARRDIEAAWREYLADRLNLCTDALTADSVTAALRERNVDVDLIVETRKRFEEKDAADYGPKDCGGDPADRCRGTRRLVWKLQQATVPLLLLVAGILLPSRAFAAESADEFFSLAMRMREQKPDEAQPLFVEAALRFESDKRFLNAGNSWFFAGENGRALANYRAAERRAPLDRQIQESIDFLRANRMDAYPPRDAPAGKLAALWSRYCMWTPMLRVGSLVLAYLLAWSAILTAQLTGRRFPRAVWTILFVAVVVPIVSLTQTSFRHADGVVVEDAVARLGPGYAYDAAFEQPLHKATEFSWMELRRGWVHVRLPDDSEGWLRASDCLKVE